MLYSFTLSLKFVPTLIFVQTSHDLSGRLKLLKLTCKQKHYKIMILFAKALEIGYEKQGKYKYHFGSSQYKLQGVYS